MKHLRFGELRQHQFQAVELAEKMVKRMLAGLPVDLDVVAAVVPGGGKTLMASLIAHILYESGIINGVIYLAPSRTLIDQVEHGFTSHERNLPLRLVKSLDTLMQMGLVDASTARNGRRQRGHAIGLICSYDWIRVDKNRRRLLQWAQANRVLIIADEGHRLGQTSDFDEEDDEEAGGDMAAEVRGWAQAYQALRDVARLGLVMTGTLFRNDGRAIAGVTYGEDRRAIAQIRYGRLQALLEHASRRIEFVTYDGKYTAKFRGGTQTITLGSDDADAKALSTFLDNWEYVTHILEAACHHYDEQWEQQGVRSQMLVICNRRKMAKRVEAWLAERYGDKRKVVRALGDDGKAARTVLNKFRQREEGHILVTVAMTAEGFDAPGIDHLVLLTKKRSANMIDQMINRATRVDRNSGRPWAEQWAYIFGPADARLMHFFQRYFDETAETYADQPEPKQETPEREANAKSRQMVAAPKVTITDERAGAIDQTGARLFPDEINRKIDALKKAKPELRGLSRDMLAWIATHVGQHVASLPEDVIARGVAR